MTPLSADHFQRRAREHHTRISALAGRVQGAFSHEDVVHDGREIKAELVLDREWANSSRRIHSLSIVERRALAAICAAYGSLNQFRVSSNPAAWGPMLTNALSDLANYDDSRGAHAAEKLSVGRDGAAIWESHLVS